MAVDTRDTNAGHGAARSVFLRIAMVVHLGEGVFPAWRKKRNTW
jgi:hypothetical protein